MFNNTRKTIRTRIIRYVMRSYTKNLPYVPIEILRKYDGRKNRNKEIIK